MAVPKKKLSKSRRDSRKDTWKKKVLKKFQIALAFARAEVKQNFGKSFVK
jgi:ribosomal protein L32